MNRVFNTIILATITLAVTTAAGCNGDNDRNAGANTGSDSAQLAPPATSAAVDSVAVDTAGPVITHTAVISTTMGDIEVGLFGRDAPKTVENFVGLTKKDVYKGTAFHRVIAGFMIQGGDPNSKDSSNRPLWGQGGESIYGGTFADELDPNTASARLGYSEGVLAMANSGPNTNGSQFFIVLTTQGARHLRYQYTIFGRVLNGMDIVHRIEETGATGEQPLHPAYIKGVTVKEATR